MARPRIPAEKRPKQTLGKATAVTVSLRVDVELMVRLEKVLHQRVVTRIRSQGERGSESASSLIREAMEDWLDRQEAATRRKKKA